MPVIASLPLVETPVPLLLSITIPKLAIAELEREITRMQSFDPSARKAAADALIKDGNPVAEQKLELILRQDNELHQKVLSKTPGIEREKLLPEEVRRDISRLLMVLSTMHAPLLAMDGPSTRQISLTLGSSMRRRRIRSSPVPSPPRPKLVQS